MSQADSWKMAFSAGSFSMKLLRAIHNAPKACGAPQGRELPSEKRPEFSRLIAEQLMPFVPRHLVRQRWGWATGTIDRSGRSAHALTCSVNVPVCVREDRAES